MTATPPDDPGTKPDDTAKPPPPDTTTPADPATASADPGAASAYSGTASADAGTASAEPGAASGEPAEAAAEPLPNWSERPASDRPWWLAGPADEADAPLPEPTGPPPSYETEGSVGASFEPAPAPPAAEEAGPYDTAGMSEEPAGPSSGWALVDDLRAAAETPVASEPGGVTDGSASPPYERDDLRAGEEAGSYEPAALADESAGSSFGWASAEDLRAAGEVAGDPGGLDGPDAVTEELPVTSDEPVLGPPENDLAGSSNDSPPPPYDADLASPAPLASPEHRAASETSGTSAYVPGGVPGQSGGEAAAAGDDGGARTYELSSDEIDHLLAYDRDHVWHPYAPTPATQEVHPVVSAEGVRLRLADGRELIDGMSSWWAVIHGHNHPALNAAVTDQLGRMAHVMFGGLTHPPAVRLAERLVEITPEPLTKVFFADSGSVSVEVAIKMALQYWRSQGQRGRNRLLTVRGGYHGDTFGDMAVCDPVNGMHHLFTDVLPKHVFAPPPPAGYGAPPETAYLNELTSLVKKHARELAAIIVEPIVQGAGGMRFYSPAYLRALRDLADQHRLLLILDEVATGFGRSGRLFGCEHAGVAPDIMCLGKALTGGYLTMSATLCTDEVARGLREGEAGALMHGPTFMANPLAAAVAAASIDELLSRDWHTEVAEIEAALADGLAEVRGMPGVADVRTLGAIGVIESERTIDVEAVQKVVMDHGVWLRPFRNMIYTMPPYVCTPDDLAQITTAMTAATRTL